MRIRSLHALGWRNLEPLELGLDPAARLTVLGGDNGQGKTNVLEAIYYLATLRSFRTAVAGDLVRVGDGEARIGARIERAGLERRIEVRLTSAAEGGALAAGPAAGRREPALADGRRVMQRAVSVDGKNVRSLGAVLGTVGVVLFVPEDLLLPRGAPAARRRFMDMAVFGVERAYFAEAASFQKILRSRNALLRPGAGGRGIAGGAGRGAAGAPSPTLLETYDEQLALAGARVMVRRRALVSALGPHVRRYFQALHADLPVDLVYVTEPPLAAVEDEAGLVEALQAGFRARRSLDERRGHTTLGPQNDDLEIRLAGRPARAHASQGQLRSLVLALKLAEMVHAEACLGEVPVLLLDDVPSELDPHRRRYLFDTLSRLNAQTLISVADPAVVPPQADRADFVVERGRVRQR